jgi:hypothetical protein
MLSAKALRNARSRAMAEKSHVASCQDNDRKVVMIAKGEEGHLQAVFVVVGTHRQPQRIPVKCIGSSQVRRTDYHMSE